jgi:fused signal recognition particle receptor
LSFFEKLKVGLKKTRDGVVKRVNVIFNSEQIDEEFFEKLEEALILGDVGVQTSTEICERLRKVVKKSGLTTPKQFKSEFISIVSQLLASNEKKEQGLNPLNSFQEIIIVVGVNGVGKTTTVGKLAYNFRNQGKNVVIAAADTFRDAAISQLQIWAECAGVVLVKNEGTNDPGAVIFDAIEVLKSRKANILICDTAGRLHNKKNLMMELQKIGKIVERNCLGAIKKIYLVLDATTGQNAISQAKKFKEMTNVTGIILTKLDGTSKGGVVLRICSELEVPIEYVGLGEGIADLFKFDSQKFANALLQTEEDDAFGISNGNK